MNYQRCQNYQWKVPGNWVVLYHVFCTVRTVLDVNWFVSISFPESNSFSESLFFMADAIGCCGDGPLAKEIENCFQWCLFFCFVLGGKSNRLRSRTVGDLIWKSVLFQASSEHCTRPASKGFWARFLKKILWCVDLQRIIAQRTAAIALAH